MELLSQLWLPLLVSIVSFLIGWFVHRRAIHQKTIETLEERTGSLLQARAQLDELSEQSTRFERDWTSSSTRLKKTEGELAEVSTLLETTQSDFKESNRNLIEARRELEETKHELRNAHQSLVSAESRIADLEADLNSSLVEVNERSEDLERVWGKLKDRAVELETLKNRTLALQGELDSEKDRVHALTEELSSARHVGDSTKQELGGVTALLATREDELRDACLQLAQRDEQLGQMSQLLERRYEDLLAEQDRSQKLESALENAEKQHAPCAREIAQLRLQLREVNALAELRTAERDTAKELAGKRLVKLEEERGWAEKRQTQVVEANAERQRVRAAFDQFKTEHRSREDAFVRLRRELDTSRRAKESMESELLGCRAKAQTARVEWEKVVWGLEQELTALRQQIPHSDSRREPRGDDGGLSSTGR